MPLSPAAKLAGEAIGSIVGLIVTAGIDSEMQQAAKPRSERSDRPGLPLRQRLGRVLRWLRRKPRAP